jgi:hypothetical protein
LESQEFMQRITCSLLLWSALSVDSTELNCLQFDVWVFGIAYLNIALLEMALTQFCLHVLHMWKDNNQVDASLPQGLRHLPQGLRVLQVQWLAEHEVHDSVVHGMRHAASALSPGALGHQ